MQNFALRVTAILILLLALTACATTMQAYEGPKKSKGETSTLRSSWGGPEIVSLDGNSLRHSHPPLKWYLKPWEGLRKQPNYVEMLPGRHGVTLSRFRTFTLGVRRIQRYFTFNSEAGHDYTAKYDSRCATLWIEDDISGQVIAGSGPCED